MQTAMLSVIIVNWNTAGLLRNCLRAIETHGAILNPEVIVVDNASTDGSPDVVATEFPWVRLIRNADNVGFARANNQGLQVAEGRYLLLLNSDTEVQGDSLADMVHYLDEHPDVGVVGGSLRNADGSRQYSADTFPLRPWDMAWQKITNIVWPSNTLTRRGRMSLWTYEAPFEVDWVLGAALMIRRTAMMQVGLLSERFFMYAEDLEWCYRVKQAGWKLVHLPDAPIYHVGGGSGRPTSLRQRMNDRSLIGFYQQHYGLAAAGGLRLVLFVRDLLSPLCRWAGDGAGTADHLDKDGVS